MHWLHEENDFTTEKFKLLKTNCQKINFNMKNRLFFIRINDEAIPGRLNP